MTQKITISPVTRIEGHAKITIHLNDQGQVENSYFHVTQYRGFEKFCEGRPFYEMPEITERSCGICPVSHHLAAAKAVGADRVELYTEPYAAAWGTPDQAAQLARFAQAAQAALDAGLEVNAGHDLNRDNLTAFIAQVPGVSEVSIGHALIADALELGYSATIKEYLRCIRDAA